MTAVVCLHFVSCLFVVVDPDNSKLVGMMLCHTVEKSSVEPRGTYEDFLKKYPPLHASIMSLFDEMMYPGDLFESYPDDNKVQIKLQKSVIGGYNIVSNTKINIFKDCEWWSSDV